MNGPEASAGLNPRRLINSGVTVTKNDENKTKQKNPTKTINEKLYKIKKK